LRIGLCHFDTFHYIGGFSVVAHANTEEAKDFFADPTAAHKKLEFL